MFVLKFNARDDASELDTKGMSACLDHFRMNPMTYILVHDERVFILCRFIQVANDSQ